MENVVDQARENPNAGDESRQLVEGLRTGRREAFESFYDRYLPRIHAFTRRRVRNTPEAEDLTQEIFLAVMRSIDSYQERADFDSWVFGVARNVVHEYLRDTQRRHEREALAQAGGPPPTPEEELFERRAVETLGRRLAAVEPWQAEAFALRYFEQLPWSEISRRTERPPNAVSTVLERLRGRMADDLRCEGRSRAKAASGMR